MRCRKCKSAVNNKTDSLLACRLCKEVYHTKCTKAVSEILPLDTFYEFECEKCGTEKFKRAALTWKSAVIVSLLNLHSKGKSYVTANELMEFVELNWDLLIPEKSKASSWRKSICCTLSNQNYFRNMSEQAGKKGCWGLVEEMLPVDEPEEAKAEMPIKATDMIEDEWDLILKCEALTNPSVEIKRLRRKLIVRREKRQRGEPLFDLDARIIKYIEKGNIRFPGESFEDEVSDTESVFEQEQDSKYSESHFETFEQKIPYVIDKTKAFSSKLLGIQYDEPFTSPYTHRTLLPFIRRDYETEPPKLALLREIQKNTPKQPIDYKYLQPSHVSQLNRQLSVHFWPNIDVSDSLIYPDFSVVVLYRNLVIGCALMTPNAYITFFWVHPEWRGHKIGKFMIYHLRQTCVGKDILLHVAVDNPAMIVYQSYGFKAESFIVNFYEKYIQDDRSKNAFLMRLRR